MHVLVIILISKRSLHSHTYWIPGTYEVITKLQGGPSRRARALVLVLGCWNVDECSIARVLECSSCSSGRAHLLVVLDYGHE